MGMPMKKYVLMILACCASVFGNDQILQNLDEFLKEEIVDLQEKIQFSESREMLSITEEEKQCYRNNFWYYNGQLYAMKDIQNYIKEMSKNYN